MKKKLNEDYITKAKKREIKKRPRMRMHGAGIKKLQAHAGKKLASR